MPKIILSANTDWYLYNFRISLARFLQISGYEVVLVSPPGGYSPHFEAEGFKWIRWGVSRRQVNPFEEVDALLTLFHIYRQEKPDLVHHHTIKPVLYGSIAARLAGVSGIINSITGRGYVFQSETLGARLLRPFVALFFRLVFRFAHGRVIFENQSDLQFFVDSGFLAESDCFLIESVGVDTDRFVPKTIQESTPVILMCGRMLWDKGVDLFVEIARQVKTTHQARFVLVGNPDPGNPESIPETVLQNWDEQGVIEWWGWQEDMVSVYNRAQIVVLPTRYGEGVPTVLIEAAACGKPLVASDIPGCQAVVQNEVNGYLRSPGDPEAFVSVIEMLLISPELRRKMGENSRRIVLEKFTHTQINKKTLTVYRQSRGFG